MESKVNYTFVGITVLCLLAGLIIGILWLSNGFNQKTYITYAVYLHEAVTGLSEESVVKYNGVPIGKVYSISLSKTDPQEVKLLLSIEKGTPITTSTAATLISQGITGTTYVGLTANSADLTPLRALPGQPYPIIPTKPSLFYQLDRVLKEVSENVNGVSIRLQKILDTENSEAFKKILLNLQTVTDTMADNKSIIDKDLKNSDILLNNLARISEELPAVVTSLKNASHSVSVTMETSKVTVDKVLQQTLPSITTLLNRLNRIAANLENISLQVRQNPSVVIRGVTPVKTGPGEGQ